MIKISASASENRSTALGLARRDWRMVIGPDRPEAAGGERIPVENPANGEVFAHVPRGRATDVDRAAGAARRSFEAGSWRGMRPAERCRILMRLHDILTANTEALMLLEILDNGMPISRARMSIERAIGRLRYYAGVADKIYGRTVDLSGGNAGMLGYTMPEPVGVAALIVPWNGPLGAVCGKAAPALAAGCSIVIKPAEQTPLTAIAFAEYALEAGVPEGVVNVVTGYGAEAGAALVAHPEIDKISFTGSTGVGKSILRAAADTMKRVTLELGGKSPVFVFDDADMDLAIPACAAAIFSNSGQMCLAGSRLYVQRKSFDRVVDGIAAIARASRIGDGFEADTQLGPLISARQQESVLSHVEAGVAQGAELVAGGSRVGEAGYFVEPTVFANTRAGMRIVDEEIFGPVLGVAPFDGIEDVARLGNASRFGLAGGIFTGSIRTGHAAAKLLRSGQLWINAYGLLDPAMPFGGYRESGFGKEGGPEGLEAYLETKSVYVSH